MTSMTTRKRFGDLEDKDMIDDKYTNYVDSITGELVPELKTISEGSSGSSIAEMNNNTNGKVLSMGPPHVNINDNRQHDLADNPVEAPTAVHANTIMKKIKQIYMDEVPLHLSGLSLSGSGMELFVKLDQNLDKALRQANSTVTAKKGRKRKRITKNKNLRNYIPVRDVLDRQTDKEPDMDVVQRRLDNAMPKKDCDTPARHVPNEGLMIRNTKDEEEEEEGIGEMKGMKEVDAVATHSKPSVTDRIRQLKVSPRNQQPYFPFEWNQQSFRQPTPTANLQNNIIRGPAWNVDNGQIDVLPSQDTQPSTSNIQYTEPNNNHYNGPIDYSINHFPGGFQSKNLPLKRAVSPLKWPIYNARQCLQDIKDYDADYHKDNKISAINDLTRKDTLRKVRDGKVRKIPQSKNTTRIIMPSTSQEEDIRAAENCFLPTDNVKKTLSNISIGQQSSIGPQFQAELLTPQTMDAETLLKFTEYTHDLRRDLKKKYKDLSKLLKSFEDTVQYKNNPHEDIVGETEPQVGRCSVM